jgi:hypothetical protein
VPASFFLYKSNFQLPDDIWVVDLDKNKIVPARHGEPIPELPEPEVSFLKNNLNQALASLSFSPQPVKSFENFFNQQSKNKDNLDLISKSFSPLHYGNDVDSVDVATRITWVQFLTSKNCLGNFNEHTRTLRLYPRPVVAFQYNSFIRSRPIKSNFIIKLAKTQAVEFLAEWSLCPSNVAYLRIQTGIFDPSLIGDKPKWYCRYLSPIQFKTYEEKSTLAAAIQFFNQENAKSKNSDMGSSLTDESIESQDDESYSASSLTNLTISSNIDKDKRIYDNNSSSKNSQEKLDNVKVEGEIPQKPIFSPDGKPLGMFPENQAKTMCVDVDQVYQPPVDSDIINEEEEASSSSISSSSSSISVDLDNKNKSAKKGEDNDDESSVESSNSSASEHHLDDETFIESNHNKIITNLKLNESDEYRKESTDSITPINKNFPRSPVSLANNEKTRNHSQTSTTTLTDSSNNKQQLTLSKITQLGDGLLNDVANKAKTYLSANVLSDENNNLESSSAKKTTNNSPSMIKAYSIDNQMPTRHISTSSSVQQPQINQNINQQLTHSSSSTDLNSENQQFLKEVLQSVLDGQGVGWLKYNRIKRLMEDENYRNFILSRLNTSLDKKLSNDEEHIEDIKVSKAVFKGMSKLLIFIINGLEHTYANNGLGGMASAFQLLEIAHTHYCLRNESNSSGSGHSAGTMSPTLDNSPFESKENLSSLASNNSNNMEKNLSSSSSVHGLNLISSGSSGGQKQQQQFEIQTTGSIVAQLGQFVYI